MLRYKTLMPKKIGNVEIHICSAPKDPMGISIAKRNTGDQLNILNQAQIVQRECEYWGNECPPDCEIRILKMRITG